MDPTPRTLPWAAWANWAAGREGSARRRVRLSLQLAGARELAALRVDWPRLDRRRALYTPPQLADLIRLQKALGRATPAPDRWAHPDPDTYWPLLQNVRLQRPALEGEVAAPALSADSELPAHVGWEASARGWAAGAVLLAVLVLLVRALERFLHKRLFKGRRDSEEWPRPNVRATSQRYGGDGLPPRLDSDSFQSDSRESSVNDLPPPYSECANPDTNTDPNKPVGAEEPPPPYSACYFSNPKDGIPTVHLYSRRNENAEVGQSSSNTDAEANISNVRNQDNNKISDVGCEVSANLECNVTQADETVGTSVRGVTDTNEVQVVMVRLGHEDNHVVHIEESESPSVRVVSI